MTPEVDVLARRGAVLGLGAVERRGAPGEVVGARRVAARGLDPVGWSCTEPRAAGRGTGGLGVGAEAGAVTISAAVGAATAAEAPVVEVTTAAGAAVVGAAAAAGARGVRRKTLHKTCKAVATVISEEGGDDEAAEAAEDSVAAAKVADRIRAASVTGAGATDESRADGAAEATGLEPALSGMGDTGMSGRGLAKPEKLSSDRAVVAAA